MIKIIVAAALACGMAAGAPVAAADPPVPGAAADHKKADPWVGQDYTGGTIYPRWGSQTNKYGTYQNPHSSSAEQAQ